MDQEDSLQEVREWQQLHQCIITQPDLVCGHHTDGCTAKQQMFIHIYLIHYNKVFKVSVVQCQNKGISNQTVLEDSQRT